MNHLKTKFLAVCILLFFGESKALLTAPTLTQPADKATKQSTCPNFYASNGSGLWYEFEYSTKSSMASATRVKSYYSSTIGAGFPKPLNFNTTYYWRARTKNNTDSSNWTGIWSFTTDTAITDLSPLNNAGPYSTGVYFSWHRNSVYSKYVWELDTVSTFNSKSLVTRRFDDTFTWFYVEFRDPSLKFSRKYFWRVKGINGADSVKWTPTYQFTTGDTIRIYNPSSGITRTATNLKIDWARDYYISYQIETDTTAAFNSKKRTLHSVARDFTDTYYLKFLEFDQTYYWRIRGCATTDTSKWTKPRWFNVTGFKKQNAVTFNSQIAPQFIFSWTAADSASSYRFQMDTVSGFNSGYLKDTIIIVDYKKTSNRTSVQYSNMPFGNVMYLRVLPMHQKDTGDWSNVTTSTVYSRPTNYQPFNNTKDVAINANFFWTSYQGVTKYRIQRDISPLFNSPNLVDTNTSASGITLPVMRYNTTYYWRVAMMHPYDTSEWSVVSKITTQTTPVLKSPTAFLTLGPGVAGTLVWDKMPGTQKFQVQLDTNTTFKTAALIDTLVSGDTLNYRFRELYFGKLYYWRVRAIKDADTSNWATPWYFYTYNPARLNLPYNNQTGITFTSLDWNSINGTEGYHYMLSTDSTFTTRIEGKETVHNPFFHYFVPNPTKFNTKYFWKVRVFHAKDTTTWSAVWNFTTRKRNGVVLNYPAMDQINVPLGITMQWTPVSDATQYVLEYAESSDMKGSIITVEPSSSKNVSLKPSKDYYWRVLAKNKDGVWLTDSSEVFHFTTALNFPAPNLLTPANNSIGLNTALSFSWEFIKGATYDFQYSLDSLFNAPTTKTASTNSISINGLKAGTPYFWHVRAKNSFTTSPWSNTFKFTTTKGAGIPNLEQSPCFIYPNPAKDILVIMNPTGLKVNEMLVLNSLGQTVMALDGFSKTSKEINISALKQGVYYLEIHSNQSVNTLKLIIE